MTNLDYPFVFKCTNCETETVVGRDDARGLHPDPDCFNAVDAVLEQRGWLRGKIEGMIFCPSCTTVAAEAKD